MHDGPGAQLPVRLAHRDTGLEPTVSLPDLTTASRQRDELVSSSGKL